MTDLEIFDFVAAHLIRQGKRSLGAAYCLYRGYDGMSCAVGCLIDDAFYDPSMEGKLLPNSELLQNAVTRSIGRKLTAHTIDVMSVLQRVHDRDPIRAWPAMLASARCVLFPDAPT